MLALSRLCSFFLGVSSRAFFLLCSFSFFCSSRFCSLPSRGWGGVVSWLLFPSVAWLGWRCLVVAVPGCCVLLLAPFLGRLSGAVLLLVPVLLLLPLLFRGWLAAWFGFVLVGVLSLASSGSFLCLSCASFFVGGSSPFFLAIARSLQSNSGTKRSRLQQKTSLTIRLILTEA